MTTPPPWLDHLKLLAAAESLSLDALGSAGLAELLSQGLIQKDARPQQAALETQYESLQDTHRTILEARGCADRLQKRLAPRSRMAGLLPLGGPPNPGPDDPDVQQLFHLLALLKIQLRGLDGPEDVASRVLRIQDHLQVEGRDCLDRLGDTDREIDQIKKQARPGTFVAPEGYYTLTERGQAALPEAPVLEALESALPAVFGPLAWKSGGAPHFREDPASILSYLMEGVARGERPSAVMAEYDDLLEAYDRITIFADTRTLRAKIAFLVRLLRTTRDAPKRAYLWCNRERLGALLTRMRSLVPISTTAAGWHLPYAVDLFLADGGIQGDMAQQELRTRLFEAVQRIQSELLQDTRIGDGQFVRLALTLTQAARTRNFAPGILMNRFIRQALETVMAASQSAPDDLGDRGTKLMFGAHLAHAAGYSPAKLPGPIATVSALHAGLKNEASYINLPVQVVLHAFATLDRLNRLGAPLAIEDYAGLLARIRKHIRHHKVITRALHSVHTLAGDEETLSSNLCAMVCFRGLAVPPGAKRHPDAGMAGLYEGQAPGLPPLLGSPFGTLMLG